MKTYIDCFIAWSDKQQGQATENALRSDSNVANIYHLTESIGSSKTIKYIAETATLLSVTLLAPIALTPLGFSGPLGAVPLTQVEVIEPPLSVTSEYTILSA